MCRFEKPQKKGRNKRPAGFVQMHEHKVVGNNHNAKLKSSMRARQNLTPCQGHPIKSCAPIVKDVAGRRKYNSASLNKRAGDFATLRWPRGAARTDPETETSCRVAR